jgi:CheY-like chemotaxis protein
MPDPKVETSLTILIVEDEFLLRELVAEHLREAGWNVLEAASGEQALAHLATAKIDVIFTDIRLEGDMNGWDLAEAGRERIANLPVIYTTGHSIDPPRPVSGSILLQKPYAPSQVARTSRELVSARYG